MQVENNGAYRGHSSQPFNSIHGYNQFGWRYHSESSSAPQQIVNALRIGDREKASKMLLDIGHANSSLSADDFVYILEYCAQTPDPLFVMEAWKVMEEKAVGMNKRSCRFVIQALSKGGYLKEALNWLTSLRENDHVHADLPMFNILLSGCENQKNLKSADQCLELMEDQLMGKSEMTYWEFLKLAVMQENLSAVHEIWKDYTRYYSPSLITLRKFVRSFTKLHDLESAYYVLQLMMALVRQESACVTKSATGRYQSSRLDIPIPLSNNLSGVRDWLDTENSLQTVYEGIPMKAEKGLDEVLMDVSRCGNRLLYKISNNVKSARNTENQPDLPDTSNALFSETHGNRFINGVERGQSNSQMFPTITNAIRSDNWNFAVKQEERIKSSNEVMKRALEMASPPVLNLLRWSFNDILHACAWSNNWQLAEQLFLQMHSLGLEPSQHTYDGFVKAVVSGKGVAYGMKVIKSMEKKNIEPYSDTLAALSIGHSKNLELDTAEVLLEKISKNILKYIHSFNALLAACIVVDEPERAVRVLAKVKCLNVKLNIRTYELMFSLFGIVNVPYEKGNMLSHVDVAKRIKAIEMDMIKNGIRHSYTSMKNMIRALGAEGMIQEMLQYLNVAEHMLWETDPYQKADLYSIVLHALVEAKEIQKAIEVFRNMRLYGLPANVTTYNIMIECCSKLTCFKSACALVSMMLRDGFYPQLLTYTALMKVLLANENFEGALWLLDQSRAEGIHPDIQLFNTILREASLKGQIDIIEFIIEHMHREKIQPDPSTLGYTFCAYVECGFHNTAMEALQVLSLRMISEEDSILQEKRVGYEDLVHSEDPDIEKQIVETFKESQEFIATALLNLRWCAIIGCSISWSLEENLWAKRLSSSYGSRRKGSI